MFIPLWLLVALALAVFGLVLWTYLLASGRNPLPFHDRGSATDTDPGFMNHIHVLRLEHEAPSMAEPIRAVVFEAYLVEAELLGVQDFTVSTSVRNHPALRLYASHRFREHRLWTTDDGIPMVTLRRTAVAEG